MALVNSVDPVRATAQLTRWLALRLPPGSAPELTDVHIPKESGLSAETVMLRAAWTDQGRRREQRLVARVAPTGPGLYMDYNIEREAQVMRAVADHGAPPVPAVRWFDNDAGVLGAPFLVMDHVDGLVPLDDPPFTAQGWVVDLTPEQQARMYENALAAMASVHQVPVDGLAAAFDRPDLGSTLVERHVRYVEQMAAWATGGAANPVIEAGLQWLVEHRPASPANPCLCWGDGRLGNLVFADDLSVTAVLDWEASTIAVPEYDLGWWRFAMRHHSEGMGLALPPGFPRGDAVVDLFEQLSRRRTENLQFWEMLNGVRFCCIVARGASLMIAGGKLPPGSRMALNNPGTRVLASMLGIEPPAGDGEYYVGNR
jgi:aminoglycoside phosphotransferase (APT) family kinase protein